MGILDSQDIDFGYPQCGHKISKTVGELRLNPKFPCEEWGVTIEVDGTSLDSAAKDIDQSIEDVQKAFGRFGE